MPAHAHDPWGDPRPEPAPVSPAHPTALTLASYVEREVAHMEAEGRTMATWLDDIELIPGMEKGWATETIRELREADDPRELG